MGTGWLIPISRDKLCILAVLLPQMVHSSNGYRQMPITSVVRGKRGKKKIFSTTKN